MSTELVVGKAVMEGDGLSAYEVYPIVLEGRTIRHRYSDFEWLRTTLIQAIPSALVPPLPPKTYLRPAIASYLYSDEDFRETRRRGLEEFLISVLQHEALRECDSFKAFVSGNDLQFQALKTQEPSTWRTRMASLGKSLSSVMSRPSFPLRLDSDRRFDSLLTTLVGFQQHCHSFLEKIDSLIENFLQGSQALFATGQTLEALDRVADDREVRELTGSLTVAGMEVSQACASHSNQLKCVLKYRLESLLLRLEAAIEAVNRRELYLDRLSTEYSSLTEKKQRMSRDKYMELDVKEQEHRFEQTKEELERFSGDMEREVKSFVKEVREEIRRIVTELTEMHVGYYEQTAVRWAKVFTRHTS